jgi:SAM-dependent methyltransferase
MSDRPAAGRPSPLAAPRLWDLVADDYARDVAPHFALYVEDALGLAGVGEGSRFLDVACGPGLLAISAARRGARASAVDISAQMIARARDAARAARVDVDARVGDGAALPFDDGSFDAAACLFGLMFFADRARGLEELRRVLAPGGRAVVASWVPVERVPVLADIYRALGEALPDLPFGRGNRPLCDPAELEAELGAAGFRDVDVREVAHAREVSSAEAFWEAIRRSTPPIRLACESLGPERWPDVDARIFHLLRVKWGAGPQRVTMTANVALGRR